jgi:O-antigen ligase
MISLTPLLKFLLPAGLVLATATQLRAPGVPLGVGESILVLWMCLVWQGLLRGRPVRIPFYIRPFVYFFIVVVVILSIANVVQANRTGAFPPLALHDTIAYVFLVIMMLTFGLAQLPPAMAYGMLRTIVVLGVGLFSLLLIVSLRVQQIGDLVLSTGIRFVGLAENPNQLGMLLAPMPFLCLYFLLRARGMAQRLGFLVLLLLSIWVGLSTLSDAVLVAWLAAAVVLVVSALLLRAQPYLIGRSIALNQLVILANFVLVCLCVGFVVFSSSAALRLADDVVVDVKSGDEGDSRIFLWTSGIARLGESPLIGFGGGPQIEDARFTAAREAHNSYIDFALATGLLGLSCLTALLFTVILRSQILLQPVLLAAFSSLLCFSFFHYVFRHPIFWFYLALMISIGYAERVPRLNLAEPSAQRAPLAGRLRARTTA